MIHAKYEIGDRVVVVDTDSDDTRVSAWIVKGVRLIDNTPDYYLENAANRQHWTVWGESHLAAAPTTRRDDLLQHLPANVREAIDMLLENGIVDGAHHKMWAIDQALQALAGDVYEALIVDFMAGEDGPATYSWDTGIAP